MISNIALRSRCIQLLFSFHPIWLVQGYSYNWIIKDMELQGGMCRYLGRSSEMYAICMAIFRWQGGRKGTDEKDDRKGVCLCPGDWPETLLIIVTLSLFQPPRRSCAPRAEHPAISTRIGKPMRKLASASQRDSTTSWRDFCQSAARRTSQ